VLLFGIINCACNADDQTKINAKGPGNKDATFPGTCSTCAHQACGIFGCNKDTFNKCLTSKLEITSTCSDCFADAAQYGYDNCKLACFASWCGKACLDCTAKDSAIRPCIGFDAPHATECDRLRNVNSIECQ
jgi:hypothetical protein